MSRESVQKIIDSARDALVGKLPNPQDQINTITYTLMYKFMSDIDDQSAALGGKRKFFSGDYEEYDWHQLMRADGQEQLRIFREAIENMSKNENIPQLFREIFNGAILTFNDPITLRLFLKEMDRFTHGNNDDLGDAYEYLLSIMSSQGGLGQFRTPRHLIEFIVDAVDPDKQDRIFDPACGTAGFLVEAYRHIIAKYKNTRLAQTEINEIHNNFRGFDIDPSMARIAKVNMYLHDFQTPGIIEHDTLSSESYWYDKYDVIIANPPFFDPKGGIQPHKKFSVKTKSAVVLFTDYITTHLKPHGKAGFVIQEGVLANVDTSRATVRKNLVENGLYAIVSLPAGVFNPYSPTTKTSLVFIDRKIKTDSVLYIDIKHDGFSLGVDRHPIKENDLPEALRIIRHFKDTGEFVDDTTLDVFTVEKEKLKKDSNGVRLDFAGVKNMLENTAQDNTIELVKKFNIEKGKLQSSKNVPGQYQFVTASQEIKTHNTYTHDQEAIVFAAGASGSLGRVHRVSGKFIASDLVYILTPIDETETNIDYYYHYLRLNRDSIVDRLKKGSNKKAINKGDLERLRVPNLTIEKQNEINEINEIISHKQSEIQQIQNEILVAEDKIKNLVAEQENIIATE